MNVNKKQIKLAASMVHKEAVNEPCLNWIKTRQELVDTVQEFLEGPYFHAMINSPGHAKASIRARDIVSDAIGLSKWK